MVSVSFPYIIICLLVLGLPWPMVMRLFAIAFALILLHIRLSPPVHYSDEGWLHFTPTQVWILTMTPLVALLTIRAGVRLARGKSLWFSGWIGDSILAGLVGGVLALWAFVQIGQLSAGSDHTAMVHVSVLAMTMVAALAAWRMRGTFGGILSGLALAGMGLTIWSAAIHPQIVLREAEALANRRPYCIALQLRGRAARDQSDLTFLTMDKRSFSRHAILVIQGEPVSEAAHWSYHRQAFLRRGGPLSAKGCAPTK